MLEKDENDHVKVQLNILLQHKEDDWDDFYQKYDNIRVEMDSVDECFQLLNSHLVNTNSEPYFLSILQHLLFIREDPFTRLVFVFSCLVSTYMYVLDQL